MITDCKLGPVEQDGARYCHEHLSFIECWHENKHHCPRALKLAAERRAQQAIERENRE